MEPSKIQQPDIEKITYVYGAEQNPTDLRRTYEGVKIFISLQ